MPIRLSILLAAALVLGAPIRADSGTIVRFERALAESQHAAIDGEGRVRRADRLAIQLDEPVLAAASSLSSHFAGELPRTELRHVETRESLAGTHIRYQQYVDGIEIVHAEVVFRFGLDGHLESFDDQTATKFDLPRPAIRSGAFTSNLDAGSKEKRFVGLRVGDEIRWAVRTVVEERLNESEARYFDAATGDLIRVEPLYSTATSRVFDANPITTLNDPSLRDLDDAASAVPEAAYRSAELLGLAVSGALNGPHVRIVELQAPSTKTADASKPLVFDRSEDEFEEVMAYFHIDRAQRHLQSLGFTGSRHVVRNPIAVDVHGAGGADNSFYISNRPGEGVLIFGDGGVDDAEDPDILLHEYGHAIADAVSPGAYAGMSSSQARALSEAISDYWAFSLGYAASVAASRDPFCIGDWDARCGGSPTSNCGYPPGADCLRRVDGAKTMSDFIMSGSRGLEHRNGEIWSSALREIFVAFVDRYGIEAGRRRADTLVMESLFGMPAIPSFADAGRRLFEADRLLEGGAHAPLICSALSSRKILSYSECGLSPKGDLTLYAGIDRDRMIVDGSTLVLTRRISDIRAIDLIQIRVDLAHENRGEISIVLVAPNGRRVVLEEPDPDEGSDIRTIYGFDTQPEESLEVLRGLSAEGDWKLEISDRAGGATGTLESWELLIRFAGDRPLESRIPAAGRRSIVAVGHADGAAGTTFLSDVRILNRGTTEARVVMYYTPSGTDGTRSFASLRLVIPAGEIITLDDIVFREFRTAGVGNLEIRGEVESLLITSRTYNQTSEGTFGQFIPAVSPDDAISAGNVSVVSQLRNTPESRSNVGFSELSGNGGTVEVRLFDGAGREIALVRLPIEPFGHRQVPILGGIGGATQSRVYATFSVVAGEAAIAAYGSVVDNRSGDAIFVPAMPRPVGGEKIVPAVISAPGARGTLWRSDVWLLNRSASSMTLELTFVRADSLAEVKRSLTVAAGELRELADIVATLFAQPGTIGSVSVAGGGDDLVVTSRTWNENERGTYGQFIGSFDPFVNARGAGSVLRASHVESSSRFRTNIGISEVTGSAAMVRMRVHDASSREIARAERLVPGRGVVLTPLTELGVASLGSGSVTFEVVGGEGRILGYASVVDNITGDPIFVPAQE